MNDMNDDEFISYCETHSETPLALFNGTQVARLMRLAGHEEAARQWDPHPDLWRSLDLSDLCRKARQRQGEMMAAEKIAESISKVEAADNIINLADHRK